MKPMNRARRYLALRWLLAAIVVVLLCAGLRPHPVPETFHEEDKLYHLLGFAVLAVSTRLAFPRRAWWWLALAMLTLGLGIELAQNLEPARQGSLWDFLFDAVGVSLGLLLARLPVLRRWADPERP